MAHFYALREEELRTEDNKSHRCATFLIFLRKRKKKRTLQWVLLHDYAHSFVYLPFRITRAHMSIQILVSASHIPNYQLELKTLKVFI